ncbi:MAG: hypothetical protein D6776_01435 [Planctomycetota bacterium]|nr:MAG: hypothetical protein D6776_01435 [Planctomycetota bacterium]
MPVSTPERFARAARRFASWWTAVAATVLLTTPIALAQNAFSRPGGSFHTGRDNTSTAGPANSGSVANAVAFQNPPCPGKVLLTGIDDDNDGLDDRWRVRRPDGTETSPHIVRPLVGWRGAVDGAGPFLDENAPLPVLGLGQWIDGGHPDGPDREGFARSDEPGDYVFTMRLDLAGLAAYEQVLTVVAEWDAVDELVEVRVNGVAVPGIGADGVADFIDNRTGRRVAGTERADNARQIHRFVLADPDLFDFGQRGDETVINTIEFVVRHADTGPVGLLVTAGEDTSVPFTNAPVGPFEVPACIAPGVPVYYDGEVSWAGTVSSDANDLGLPPSELIPSNVAIDQRFVVVELTPENRRALATMLAVTRSLLMQHEPTARANDDLQHSVDPDELAGRFLYLYQTESSVPCLALDRLAKTGAFRMVGHVDGNSEFEEVPQRRLADSLRILEPIDPRTRLVFFSPPMAQGRFVPYVFDPFGTVRQEQNPSRLVYDLRDDPAVPCAPFGDVPFGPGSGGLTDFPGQLPEPPSLQSWIWWGTSDRPPVLSEHDLDWSFDLSGGGGFAFPAAVTGPPGPGTGSPPSTTGTLKTLQAGPRDNTPPEIVDAQTAGISSTNAPVLANTTLRVFEGDELEAQIFAIDADGDPLWYGVLDVPAGMRFDPKQHMLTWKTELGDAGTYTVTALVTDGQASAKAPVEIQVLPARGLRGGASGCAFSGRAARPGDATILLLLLLGAAFVRRRLRG